MHDVFALALVVFGHHRTTLRKKEAGDICSLIKITSRIAA